MQWPSRINPRCAICWRSIQARWAYEIHLVEWAKSNNIFHLARGGGLTEVWRWLKRKRAFAHLQCLSELCKTFGIMASKHHINIK